MIFISHAGEDQARARAVADALTGLGVQVWLDARGVRPADEIVGEVEAALARAEAVLVLWSRFAAGSRWVQLERGSAIARMLNGAPVRVVMARLDDTDLPALQASELALDLRDPTALPGALAPLVGAAAGAADEPPSALIDRTELPRRGIIDEIVARLPNGAVVVLGPRKAGAHSLTHHLHAHLLATRPSWTVLSLPVRVLPGESTDAYLARMHGLIDGPDPDRHRVLCTQGWSASGGEQQTALAIALRSISEASAAGRGLSVVAIGAHPLHRLRYSQQPHSLFSDAYQLDLTDFDAEQCLALLQRIAPGRWTPADAADLVRRSGGHPFLLKLLLRAAVQAPEAGWAGAEAALRNDHQLLIPALARALGGDQGRTTAT